MQEKPTELKVNIPDGISVEISGAEIKISGAKGSLSRSFPREIKLEEKDGNLAVIRTKENKFAKSIQGTARAHIENMIKGVTDGWAKKLEIIGTGYRAEVRGKDLILTAGYSHPVEVAGPEGVAFKVEKNVITIEGIDKEVVGQVAARVRAVRPPEPYKGKGIKYQDEYIRRKPGKAAAKTAGA